MYPAAARAGLVKSARETGPHTRLGRPAKTMGDGFLVEFGSVVDAFQCATDIQEAVALQQNNEPDDRKMLFRMSIHLGNVIVEGEDMSLDP